MPHIQVNDISMYYEIDGEGEPLVFIGGFGTDHMDWSAVKYRFTQQYQVLSFDNRGAGQTDVPETPYSAEQMADDVRELCFALGIKHAHFVGSSMGGFILQILAVRCPELVKSAIISNCSVDIDSPFQVYVNAQYELLQAQAPLESLLKSAYSWMFSYRFLAQPGMLNLLVQLGLARPHPFSLAGYKGQSAALREFNSSSWVQQITAPTLVLAADQDLVFSEPRVQKLVEQIPNAYYYCFTECGHLPHIEYPEKFAQIVQEFISTRD
jgi:3-oxoadipate enol-lactonase